MKKKNIIQLMGYADDKYIAEADPTITSKPKIRKRTKLLLFAACFMTLMTAAGLVLFIPFNGNIPDVSEYSNSEYYSLIEKLNELNYEPPEYKNNYDKLTSSIKNIFLNKKDYTSEDMDSNGFITNEDLSPTDNAGRPGETVGSSQYQEVTDNQVNGIIEADRIKRSDSHIFYLDGKVLKIFEISKENTRITASYDITTGIPSNTYITECGFFLSTDCKTVTVIAQIHYWENICPEVIIISLDVSNPNNIVLNQKITVSGNYISSRTTNGELLLITAYSIDKEKVDFDDNTTFIPYINGNDGCNMIAPENIVIPRTLDSSTYTAVWKLDEKTLETKGEAAYLSYSYDVYVSYDNIYLTHRYVDTVKQDYDKYTETTMTEISALTYTGDKFEQKGNVTVSGYLKDQYSMDEKDGILRVVTTLETSCYNESEMYYCPNCKAHHFSGLFTESKVNASLYCIDISSWQKVAEVPSFAPDGESVRSVRFDGKNAYVCTSIRLQDPVFFFDLSDMNNISYKETGTIEGFSTSLINMGNGYLLGIGRGSDWNKFKVEIYKESENGVVSVCSYEPEGYAYYSEDYKSYYINREKGLFGFGLYGHTMNEKGKDLYILLRFNEEKLQPLIYTELNGDPYEKRGVLVDGYMYMFGSDDFKVIRVEY